MARKAPRHEGYSQYATASGQYSHAEGQYTNHEYAHAEGYHTTKPEKPKKQPPVKEEKPEGHKSQIRRGRGQRTMKI